MSKKKRNGRRAAFHAAWMLFLAALLLRSFFPGSPAEKVSAREEESAECSSETDPRLSEPGFGSEDAAGTSGADPRLLEPGDTLGAAVPEDALDSYFFSSEIAEGDAVYERINGKSYRENEVIALSDLRYLRLLHYNFDHEVQVGEMIVHKNIADTVLDIFRELYEEEYEIQSVFLVDDYWSGDPDSTDFASVEENNSSCFNFRAVTGGESLSHHAYGCAIDINPQQNPYLWVSGDGTLLQEHENAAAYVDRADGGDHRITEEDPCCQIFKSYGFRWGGDWSNPIDYQHFEIDAY